MKLKWERISTGGGCEALCAELPGGDYILITAHDDPAVPRPGEPVSVGWYKDAYNIDSPAWARQAAQNPEPSCVEEPLLFPNVTTAKKVLADGYR